MIYTMFFQAFCLVTLLQCCVEMAEAIENFVVGRSDCIETYGFVNSLLQFAFSSLQFLFIFSKGNVTCCLITFYFGLQKLIFFKPKTSIL